MRISDTLIKSPSIQKTLIDYLNIWGFMDILSTAAQKILGAMLSQWNKLNLTHEMNQNQGKGHFNF